MNTDISDFFVSYAETEDFPLVMCDLDYRITYINPAAAKAYENYGGRDLVGRSLSVFMDEEARSKVDMVIEWFKEDREHNCLLAVQDNRSDKDIYMCALRNGNGELIGFCSRHRSRIKDSAEPYTTID